MLIGTDGIREAGDAAGELFGRERLGELLIAWAERSAAEIRAAVVAAVKEFRGARPQQDDITLVVIKAL